jgi:acyl-coenzyme A thioesterase PaaI-like protein
MDRNPDHHGLVAAEQQGAAAEENGVPVSHYPRCFGCGHNNAMSLRLEAYRTGDRLHADWTPPAAAEGGPGVVHGGYLAAAADELLALLASSIAEMPAMTARIQVRYLAPALTGRALRLEAEVVERKGRKLDIAMRAMDRETGAVCVEGTGTYVAVPTGYWGTQMDKQGINTASLDLTGGDASTYFGWHVRWLREAYRPASQLRPVRVLVELADIVPSRWLMLIDADGLHVAPAPNERIDVDASLSISFPIWQAMLMERDNVIDTLRRHGGIVEGDEFAIVRFISQLPRKNGDPA